MFLHQVRLTSSKCGLDVPLSQPTENETHVLNIHSDKQRNILSFTQ